MTWAKKNFILRERQNLDYLLQTLAANWERQAKGGHALFITVQEEKRSLEQNALIHVLVRVWAKKVEHPVNGVLTHLSETSWKRLLMASFRGDTQQVTTDLNGNLFFLDESDSLHTGDLPVSQATEFIHYLIAGLGERGIPVDAKECLEFDGRCA